MNDWLIVAAVFFVAAVALAAWLTSPLRNKRGRR